MFGVPLSGDFGPELASPIGADGQETVTVTMLTCFSPGLVLFERIQDGFAFLVRVDLEPEKTGGVVHHHVLVEAIADRTTQVGVYELKGCRGLAGGVV